MMDTLGTMALGVAAAFVISRLALRVVRHVAKVWVETEGC